MYQMAAYCRLSKDDGENKISESIENQMKLIREYVGKSEDLEIADIYIDDGYSGLYFANRPEFQRMMEDIYKGKIQGVITKDISRLGREHIETSNYIERVFPSLGIRYIAILDGVDSVAHSNEELAQTRYLRVICTAVIFPRRSEAHFLHRKSEGSLCRALLRTDILRIRRISIISL